VKKAFVITVVLLALALVGCGKKEAELVGATWQWQEFQDSAGASNISVSDPDNYTLTLQEDGTAAIKADCNQVMWSYELDDSRLTFNTLGPSTLAACGDDSLDQVYLERLGNTATYVMADGKLHLNLRADAGNMVFAP
jgi:heat shock protein HslJ